MKLENQVVSLDLAKRLKELGVKQENEFYWRETKANFVKELGGTVLLDKSYLPLTSKRYLAFSAFTVAELGEMLGGVNEDYILTAYGKVFNVPDTKFITGYGLYQCLTEPNILAKMLIYLLENELISSS